MKIPTDAQFWSSEDASKPDVAFLKNHFYREGRLSEEQALHIINAGTQLLCEEPTLLHVDAPITGIIFFVASVAVSDTYQVCGDIHGQYASCFLKVDGYCADACVAGWASVRLDEIIRSGRESSRHSIPFPG